MGWHEVANATPRAIGWQILPLLENFVIFYCCYIFAAKEGSPEVLVELRFGLCDILESSIFPCTLIFHLTLVTQSSRFR